MTFSNKCNEIFDQTVKLYHVTDDIDAVFNNPFEEDSIWAKLARKNWIDAVQWHLEDLIRDEDIDPVEALALKHRIDHSICGQGRCSGCHYIIAYVTITPWSSAGNSP